MHRKKSRKLFPKFFKLIIFSLTLFIGWKVFLYSKKPERIFENENIAKVIIFNNNGIETKLKTNANTVEDFLLEQKISLKEQDEIFPSLKTVLSSGNNIRLNHAVKIKILVDGKKIENYTLSKDLLFALKENNVTLGRLDKTTPEKNGLLEDGLEIVVTRINVEEKIIPEEIDFKSKTKTDSKLGWREKKTETKGEKGVREIKYKITYKNGKEISRVVLEKTVTKEPVTEVIVQGTYVKIGKAHKGQGTWYAFKGGLYAASPWLPMGSFAKVTNTANGKSVMVEINDRGPFGKGRIIDLDKVAFEKIASIGAGVIGVKVEEVLN